MNPIRAIRSTFHRNILDNCNKCKLTQSRVLLTLSKSNPISQQCSSNSTWSGRNFSSNPSPIKSPTIERSNLGREVNEGVVAAEGGIKLDMDLVQHLERTSLVDFGNEEALKRLEEAVQFANTLFEVDTTGVEPLTSVLEDVDLFLREDKVGPTSRADILANASVTEEDYFVAPPGNIPLDSAGSVTKKNI